MFLIPTISSFDMQILEVPGSIFVKAGMRITFFSRVLWLLPGFFISIISQGRGEDLQGASQGF